MTIVRTFDAAPVNAIVNSREVYPWVRGPISGPLDMSAVVSDQQNVTLLGEYGAAIFYYRVPGVYEWHAAVLPEGHGRWALWAARMSLDYMFKEIDAIAIIAPVPENNRPARQVIAALGFGLKQALPSLWPYGGQLVDLLVYVLFRRDWMRQN